MEVIAYYFHWRHYLGIIIYALDNHQEETIYHQEFTEIKPSGGNGLPWVWIVLDFDLSPPSPVSG